MATQNPKPVVGLPPGFTLAFARAWQQLPAGLPARAEPAGGDEVVRRLGRVLDAASGAVWWRKLDEHGQVKMRLDAGYCTEARQAFQYAVEYHAPGVCTWDPRTGRIDIAAKGPFGSWALQMLRLPEVWSQAFNHPNMMRAVCTHRPAARRNTHAQEPVALGLSHRPAARRNTAHDVVCDGLETLPGLLAEQTDPQRVKLITDAAFETATFTSACPLCMVAAAWDFPDAALDATIGFCRQGRLDVMGVGQRTPAFGVPAAELARLFQVLSDIPAAERETAAGLWFEWRKTGTPIDQVEEQLRAALQ